MEKQDVLDFISNISDLHEIQTLKQHWRNRQFSYEDNARPNFGLMLLLNGHIDFTYRDKCISARPGDLIFFPKNSHYSAAFHSDSGATDDYLINFHTSTEFVHDVVPLKLFEDASYACEDYLKQLLKENLSINSSSLRKQGLLYLLFDSILTMQNKEDSALHNMLQKAQNLLKNDYELSIPEIARRCCTSESSLRRFFFQHIGMSPAKYRLQMKLNQAMFLLDSTDMSVNEIAASLNFYDTAYFCKTFRAHIGISPRQYALKKKL